MRQVRTGVPAFLVILLVSLVAGCGHAETPPPPPSSQAQAPSESESPSPDEDSDLPDRTAPDGRGVIRPLAAPAGCTATAQDPDAVEQALSAAEPGNTICVLGDLDTRLKITRSGTAQAPVHVVGDGKTVVKGIDVAANFVTISGVNALEPKAPGISLHGSNITLENSTSISPHGGDGDGIRFWGSNIVIRHNTIAHTSNKHKAHADCMQTFATDADSPASQHILIDSNRCEDISNTCLIMEGPNSLAGDGSGVGATSDVTWVNNYCQNHADEALQIDDVQGLKAHDNDIAGKINHAFALQNKTTGAQIGNNRLSSELKYEVGIDASSAPGYQGPPSGGNP